MNKEKMNKESRHSTHSARSTISQTEIKTLIESLLEDNWASSVSNLSEFREEAIKALIPFLAEKDERKKWKIILAISRISETVREPAINELLKALKEPELRDNAEKCLSLIADPRIKRPWVVDSLLKALKDENEFARAKAAELLGEIGDKRSIKPLIDALADAKVNEKAAWALAFMGKRCVSELVDSLKTTDPRIRDAITEIIVKIGEDAVDTLISALNSDLWFVRKSAVYALGEIGNEKSIRHLKKMLEDEDLEVREAARSAIDKIDKTNRSKD
ncbi:MAG: HEAT repeat domain-containing protein [Archaeoglobus sp.]|nr:HEAT repeat domain-containing protein [Archaeoglobus sp.]